MIIGKNQIGFEESSKGNKYLKTFNPQLDIENSEVYPIATEEEIEEAVTLAYQAYKVYKNTSGVEKAAFLNAIADEILSLGDELLEMYIKESGLPRGRAEGERGRTIGQLRSFADMLLEGSWVEATIETAQPNRMPIPRSDLRKMLVPIGPIVVFGSSNFPFAFSTAGGDTASALAAGCPVIVKSHSMHIGTGCMVAKAVSKAAQLTNMPNGVFSNLIGNGRELGTALVVHPKVKGVGFTGSIMAGRTLFDLAAKRKEPIPVFAEMGSVNPVVLLPNELKNNGSKWASILAGSVMLGTGQFCTKPGLVLAIEGEGLDLFIDKFSVALSELTPSCMLHHSIKKSFDEGRKMMQVQNEVTTVTEYQGEIAPNYATQTLLSVKGDDFLKNKDLHEEVFGPFSLIVQCKSDDQLLEVIESLQGQLTGTIIGEINEITEYKEVINSLKEKVGRLIFNGVPTGVEVCPSMLHGGPYPASTDSRFTAVGNHAVKRWVRPVSYQDWPQENLPEELQNSNPLGIFRTINKELTKDAING